MPGITLDKIDKQIMSNLLSGNNITQTAENLDISRQTIYNRLGQNLTIIEALNNAGINTDYLANKAKELLEAKRPLYNPKTQEFQDVPDNNARNTAFSTTCKLAGHLRDNAENNQNIQVNLINYSDVKTDKNVEVEGTADRE
jgi:hypothetical protein